MSNVRTPQSYSFTKDQSDSNESDSFSIDLISLGAILLGNKHTDTAKSF